MQMIPPKVNNLGRITEHPIDVWEPRSGVALALQELAPFLEPDIVSQLVSFFVTTGLGDRKPEVIVVYEFCHFLSPSNNCITVFFRYERTCCQLVWPLWINTERIL